MIMLIKGGGEVKERDDLEEALDWDDLPAHCKDCQKCRHYIPDNVTINDKGALCCRVSNFEFIENYPYNNTCSFYVSRYITEAKPWKNEVNSKMQQKRGRVNNHRGKIVFDEEDNNIEYAYDDDGRAYKRIYNEESYSEQFLRQLLSLKNSMFSNSDKDTALDLKKKSVITALVGMFLFYWFVSTTSFSDIIGLILLFVLFCWWFCSFFS